MISKISQITLKLLLFSFRISSSTTRSIYISSSTSSHNAIQLINQSFKTCLKIILINLNAVLQTYVFGFGKNVFYTNCIYRTLIIYQRECFPIEWKQLCIDCSILFYCFFQAINLRI